MVESTGGIGRPLSFRRCGAAAFGAAALLLLGEAEALASAGCDAVNAGGYNRTVNAGDVDTTTINNFAVGDKITFTSGGNLLWKLDSGNGPTVSFDFSGIPFAKTYTVTGANGDTTLTQQVTGLANGAIITGTCVAAPPAAGTSSSNTDSQKLRSLQVAATTSVATVSGGAITQQVDSAITEGFSDSGTTITPGPNGISFNFAAEPQRSSRIEQAYQALGYAPMPVKAVPQTAREWRIWGDIRGTGWTTDEPAGNQKGRQINLTGGVTRVFNPQFLAGVFTGYESFTYDVASLAGKLTGHGGSIGGYVAYRAGFLRLDGAVGYTHVDYDAAAGTAAGAFHGDRWLFSAGLTGAHRFAAWTLEPSAKVYVLRESENAWTDSLGTLQAARTFTVGRGSIGSRAIYIYEFSSLKLAPYVGLYGDYRFSTDDALPVAGQLVGIKDGASARVTGGAQLTNALGASVSLNGELGGLASNSYRIWTCNIRGSVPF